jgi:hypothetical protein
MALTQYRSQKASLCLYGCFSIPPYLGVSLWRWVRKVLHALYPLIRSGVVSSSQAEQRPERAIRLPASIVARNDLVEVELDPIKAHP